jgi:hypothetical protein
MSGARGLMLFSKGSCLEPAAALTKNSLGGGVMGARDLGGPCGAAELTKALVLLRLAQPGRGRSGQPNKFAARQALMTTHQGPWQPCKDSMGGFIHSRFTWASDIIYG